MLLGPSEHTLAYQKLRTSEKLITVSASILLHGYAKGKREYSSTIVKIYLSLVAVGKGPLKSMFNRSKGRVALMSTERKGY